VVGDPVSRSLSPAMHSAAIAALGLDAQYVALRTSHEAFPALVYELLSNGGACNVTMPFKDDAFALRGEPTAVARRTRAVNTVWGDADRPQLDNTDVPAIRIVARRLVGDGPVTVVRIFGTGGAARAAAVAVSDEWPEVQVEVVSRSAERATAFVAWAEVAGVRCHADADIMTRLDLTIRATPVDFLKGDYPVRDPGPMATFDPPAPAPALDLAYAKGGTSLVRGLQQAGCRGEDGRGVLVEQGALAFERFFGVPAPVEVMREAVENALRA
jgi:shikimate dehydrogenase